MRVLVVTPYLASVYGGTFKAVTDLVQEISSCSSNIVDAIATNANGLENLDVLLGVWLKNKHYRVQYFPCWHRNDLIISWSMISWLINHTSDYDIVHANTVFAPIVLLTHWICQLRQIPYVVTPHGMLEPWAMSSKAWKKQFYYSLFEKLALQKAGAIHVLTNSEANNVKSLGIKHSVVVPNGIHRQEFENLPEPEVFYQQFPGTQNKTLILFLGRIDPKKGLDLLAPAFAKVHNQFPQTHLVVAGPDSTGFLPTAQNYFAQAGCLDAVTFTGMLTGQLKYAALAAASLYVAPSHSEGFSMSVLEGMASRLPCVITTGCNFPEAAVVQVAHVVNIDSGAIANALIDCLSHPQQSKEMGDRARDFIFQNYTWEQAAKKMIQVYKAVIEKKPLPEYLSNVE